MNRVSVTKSRDRRIGTIRANSLRWRLTLLLVSGYVWTLIVVGVGVTYFVYRAEAMFWHDRQVEAARYAAASIAALVDGAVDDLHAIGALNPDPASNDRRAFEILFQQNDSLAESARLDAAGRVLASLDRGAPVLSTLFTIPQSRWFLEAKSGQVYLGDVQLAFNDEPYLIMAQPAQDGGVVAARVRLNVLDTTVAAIRIGKTGRAYVINQAGHIIAHSDPNVVLSRVSVAAQPEYTAIRQAPAHAWYGTYVDFHGERVEGASAQVAGTDWIVMTALPQTEASATSRMALMLISATLVFIGTVTMLLISRRLERAMFKPMEQLAQGARRVGQGDLRFRIGLTQRDEIGQVAEAFDDMAVRLFEREEDLRLLNANLANRVAQRTAELEQVNATILGANGRLQHLLTSSATVIYSTEAGGSFSLTFASDNTERQLGYTSQQLIDEPGLWASLIHPDDAAQVIGRQTELFDQGERTIEYRLRHKDGTYRWIQDEARLIRDPIGQPVEIVGSALDITARKAAEEASRTSEALYQSLVEVIPQSLCRKDLAGRFTFANRHFLDESNTTLAELLGKDDYDLHPRDQAEKYRADDRRVIESGQIFETVEARAVTGGSTTYVHTVKAAIRDRSGNVIGIQIMFWDVTARKLMEEALQQSEARLRQIIDLVPHFIFAKDIDGKFLLVNQAVAQAYGTTVDELLTHTDADFAQSAEEVRHFRADDLAVIHGGQPKVIPEEPITDAQGRVRLLNTTKIPFTFSGTATPAVLGVSVDITEIRRAEQALRESEERYRTLVELSPEPIIVYTEDKLVYVNPAAVKIYGADGTDEMIGKSIQDFTGDGQTGKRLEYRVTPSAVEGGALQEVSLRRKNGQTLYAEVAYHPMLYRGKHSIQVMLRDITARKQAEDALRASEDRYRGLYASAEHQAKELALLNEARTALMREIDLPEVIRTVIEAVSAIFGYKQISLYLLHDEVLKLQYQIGYETCLIEIPIDRGITGRVARTGQPLFLPDVSHDPAFLPAIDGIQSEICTPLFDRGQVVGVFNVESTGQPALDENDLHLMTALSEHISLAVGHARLYGQVQQELAERIRTEAELRRLKDFNEGIVQTMTEGVVIQDEQGFFTYANPAAAAMLHYRVEEFIGQHWTMVVSPEQRLIVEDADTRRTRGESDRYELDVISKTGARITLLISGSPWYEAGRSAGSLVVYSDITERKRAEQALRDSEERYRDLFENANDLIQSVAPDGHFVYVNRAWRETLGYESAELADLSLFDVIDPGALADCREKFQLIMAGHRFDRLETTFRARDGRPVVLEGSANCQRVDGKPVATRGIFRDITERKRVELSLAHHIRTMEDLYQTSLEINSQPDLPALLRAIVQRAATLLGAQMGGLYLLEPDGDTLTMAVNHNIDSQFLDIALRRGEGMAGHVVEMGQPLMIEDYRSWPGRSPAFTNTTVRRVLGVPLKVGDRVLGVIDIMDTTSDRFSADDIRLVSLFADQAAIAIENARLYAQVQQELAERKRTEVELRRLKDFNESIVQTMTEGVVIQDQSGDFEYANPATTAILGYAHEELLGQPGTTIVPVDQRGIVKAADLRRAHGEADQYELEVLRKDGARIFLLVSACPWYEDGRLAGSLSVFSDITQRKEVERALARHARTMEALYQTSLEINSQPDVTTLLWAIVQRAADLLGANMGGLYLTEPDGVTLKLVVNYNVSSTYVGFTLRPGEGVAGRVARSKQPLKVDDYGSWAGRANVFTQPEFKRVLGMPLKVGDRIVGVIDIMDATTRPFSDDDVRLVSLFADQAAIAVEKARLFEAVQRQTLEQAALLAASHAISSSLNLHSVLNNLAEQVGRAINATSVYIGVCEPALETFTIAAEYFGPAASDAERFSDLGVTYHAEQHFGPTFAYHMIHGVQRQYHVNDSDLPAVEHEHLMSFGGNSVVDIPLIVKEAVIGFVELWDSRRQRTFTGDEIALCEGIAQQAAIAIENARLHEQAQQHAVELEVRVSERTRELMLASEQLAAANARLTELDHLKDQFISRISHELRTPLTSVKIYLELLERAKPEKRESYLKTAQLEADRLQRLIEDLLGYTDLNQVLAEIQLLPIDVNPTVTTLVQDEQAAAAGRGLALEYDLQPHLPAAAGEVGLLRRVLSSLITNAIHYTPHGTITVTTRLQRREDKDWITVSVRDTGPGLQPIELPHIFERFYRGLAARDYKTPGTGLGLSIAQDIMTAFKGTITADSEPGQGATFTVWLRLADSDAQALA